MNIYGYNIFKKSLKNDLNGFCLDKLPYKLYYFTMGKKESSDISSKGTGSFLIDMMMEYAPIAILIIDSDGKVKGFNKDAKELIAAPHVLWEGKESLFNVKPFDSEGIKKQFTEERDNLKGFEFKIRIQNNDIVCGIYPLKRIVDIPNAYACFVEKLKREKTFGERGRKVENVAILMLESIGDAILVADAESKVISYANKKALEVLGYKKDEIIGLPLSKLHPEDEVERVLFVFERQVRGELELAEDIPFVRKDGRVIYTDINSNLIEAAGKKYVVGILRDITYKKALLTKLLTTNRLLEAIFEKTNLMFAFMSEDFKVIRVNENFAKSLGPDVDQFVGRNFFDIFQEPDLRAIFEEVVLLNHSISMKEFPFKRPDGGTVYVDFMLAPLSEEADEIRGIIFSGIDVTELVETREALRDVEYIKDTVLHELNELVSYVTPEFEIKWVNKPFLEYSVYKDFNEVVGRKCYSALDADHRPCDSCPVRGTISDSKPHSSYVKFKNGKEFYVRSFPDIRNGKLSGVVVACLDITELREREHKIERLNETLRIMKNINQVIMREESVDVIVEKVTQVLVQKKDYDFAMLILTDRMGIPVMSSIKPTQYEHRLSGLIENMSKGAIECLERVFISNTPLVIYPENSEGCEFYDVCKEGRKAIAGRLEYKGNVMGALVICVEEDSLKDSDEVELFKELTDDIAYALYHVKM